MKGRHLNLTIALDTLGDNPDQCRKELARIFGRLEKTFENQGVSITGSERRNVADANGTTVGEWYVGETAKAAGG